MRYISLFSGIEAATVAWEPLGWEPVCFAELDPFPCAVLEHRYPDVPNVGGRHQGQLEEVQGQVRRRRGRQPVPVVQRRREERGSKR